MTNEFAEIQFRKSPLKLFVSSIIYVITFITFFAMGFSSEVGLPWVAWIIAAGFFLLIARNVKNFFSKYSLIINEVGIVFCDQCYAWPSVLEVRYASAMDIVFKFDTIVVTVLNTLDLSSNEPPKPKKVFIGFYTLNASQWRIYCTLLDFHEKFGTNECHNDPL